MTSYCRAPSSTAWRPCSRSPVLSRRGAGPIHRRPAASPSPSPTGCCQTTILIINQHIKTIPPSLWTSSSCCFRDLQVPFLTGKSLKKSNFRFPSPLLVYIDFHQIFSSNRSNSVQNIGPMRPPPPHQNGNGGPVPFDQGFYQNVGGPNGYPMQRPPVPQLQQQPRYSSQTSLPQHSPRYVGISLKNLDYVLKLRWDAS